MSRFTLLMLAVCALVAHSTSAQREVCPCGLDGPLCDQLVDDFTTSLNDTCNQSFGVAECDMIPSSGKARCLCSCGIEGDLCEIRIPAEMYNFVVGYGLVAIMFCFCVYKLMKHRRAAGFKEFDIPSLETAQPTMHATSAIVLCYRLSCFLFCLGTLIGQIIYYSGQSQGALFLFTAYTVLNFCIMIIYFAMGSVLSWQSVTGKLEDKPSMTTLQRVHLVTLEIELPGAIMLDLVVWLLLLPAALVTEQEPEGLLDYYSFVMHLLNALLIVGDFCLTNVQFTREHMYFLLCLPLLYAVFHQSIMLNQTLNDLNSCPVYAFLRMDSPLFAAWVLVLPLVHVPFFLVARRLGLKYKTSAHNVSENISFGTAIPDTTLKTNESNSAKL